MLGFLVAVLFVGGAIALVRISGLLRRIEVLEENVIWLRAELRRMAHEQKETAPAAAPQAETREPEPQAEAPQPEEAAPAPVAEPEPQPELEPEIAPIPAAAFSAEETIPPQAEQPEDQRPATGDQQPPTAAPRPTPSAQRPLFTFDWENLIGVKLFSWVAGFALVLAAIFFLRYSVEHGWLSPAVRATIGLLTGTTLLIICEMRIARGYAWTANAMHGAGIAILYATLFAMHAMWHLAPATVVFLLMLLVTAVAVMLSIRRDSVFIALLGLLGGFATPALLATGENRPIGLFAYLLLLNVGLAWVAFRKGWPALTFASLLFTVVYQWGWVAKFLTSSQLPLAAGIFAVFAIVGSSAMWRRSTTGKSLEFKRLALASGIMPLAFAIFGAAVPAYGARYNTLFGFLLLMVAGLSAVAIFRGPEWVHAVGGVAMLLTFAIWSSMSYHSEAWPGVLGWLAAFIVLFLGVAAVRESDVLRPASITAGLLFFLFPLLAAREAATASPAILFGVLFALLAITAAFVIWRGFGPTYFVAAFFAILTEAVWSTRYLTPERLIPALLIYGAFALLFLAAPALARRTGKPLQPDYGVAATVILSLGVLLFLTTHSIAAGALWGLALLIGLLIAGTFAEVRYSRRMWVAGVAILLAWAVLASWWEAAPLTTFLYPALFVITLFGVVILAGSMLASRGTDADFSTTSHLALIGHAFLAFVASQHTLAIPPWPMFAVLFVLDLAIGTAALYLKRASLVAGAVVASQFVLMIWTANAHNAPWPVVALLATLFVAGFALLWRGIGIKAERAGDELEAAVVASLILGSIVAMIAGGVATKPLFAELLAAHAILIVLLLSRAWRTESHILAPIGVAIAAFATQLARTQTAAQEFTFAAVLYALFLAYPLLLGKRAKRAYEPYLAAVLASLPFFFFARHAMIKADLKWMIGALPVGQAILMVVLVIQLLRLEPLAERDLRRLATVAAAALAFITAAIPLQLEKQWITIGWALEAAALVWLFRRVPHRGLLAWSAALLGAVFIRLVFNPAVFNYHPPSHNAILNWYFYSYLVSAVSFYYVSYGARASSPASLSPERLVTYVRTAAGAGGTILLFVLLNIEIADFYSTGSTLTFNFFSSSLAQDLTYTIGWAFFAIAMLVAGIVLHQRAVRVAAILLLVITIAKCFLHDLARLGGLYRVASLLGLAASLVVVGILLQKFVMVKISKPAEGTS